MACFFFYLFFSLLLILSVWGRVEGRCAIIYRYNYYHNLRGLYETGDANIRRRPKKKRKENGNLKKNKKNTEEGPTSDERNEVPNATAQPYISYLIDERETPLSLSLYVWWGGHPEESVGPTPTVPAQGSTAKSSAQKKTSFFNVHNMPSTTSIESLSIYRTLLCCSS